MIKKFGGFKIKSNWYQKNKKEAELNIDEYEVMPIISYNDCIKLKFVDKNKEHFIQYNIDGFESLGKFKIKFW